MAFAPVVVAAPPQRSNQATPAIEVVVGVLTVRVPVGADLSTLQGVRRAVRGAS